MVLCKSVLATCIYILTADMHHSINKSHIYESILLSLKTDTFAKPSPNFLAGTGCLLELGFLHQLRVVLSH